MNISPSSSSMWCSTFSFMTLAFAPQRLVVDGESLELAHHQVDDVVLLVPLEDDVLGLRVRLELGIEDLLLDDLVERQLALDRGEQLRRGS